MTSNRQEIAALLQGIWPRVVERVGKNKIPVKMRVADRAVKVYTEVGSKTLPLKEEQVEDYLQAPNASERAARRQDIEDDLVSQIKEFLAA